MGFIEKLIGAPIASPIKEIGKIVDNLHTSGEEKLNGEERIIDAEARLLDASNSLIKLQADITKTEASHRSLFIAGWRPALAWLCVLILFFNYLVIPILGAFGIEIQPISDPEHTENLILALCGIGAYRSYEKKHGLAR